MRSFKSSYTRQGDWQKFKTPTNDNEVFKKAWETLQTLFWLWYLYFSCNKHREGKKQRKIKIESLGELRPS
jgi:hypothetical protein